MSPFWIPKHDFWRPLWHRFFIVFLNELKSRKVFVFQYFLMVLDHKKPLLFRSFFHCFFEWPKIKKSNCFSILFNGFGSSKTIDFPIVFSSIFHVFSKPLLGTVFRGSQRQTFLKSWILVPFPIFMIFTKASFGTPFSAKCRSKFLTGSRAGRPCRDPGFHETIVILVPLGPSV